MSSVAVDRFGIVGKKFKLGNLSLQQLINRNSLLKYPYRGSFPSDYIPSLGNDTFASINTQPSNKQDGHWIMITSSRHKIYLADSLSRPSFQLFKQMIPEPL